MLTESDEPSQKKSNLNSFAQEIEAKYRKIRPKQIEEIINVNNLNLLQSSNNDKPSNIQSNFIQSSNNGIFNENTRKPIFIANPPQLIQKKINNKKLENEISVEDDEKLMKSSLELFFDSMAQTVKKLPSKAQADIKLDICRIVTEAETRFSKNIQGKNKEIGKNSGIPKLVLIPCSMIDKHNK